MSGFEFKNNLLKCWPWLITLVALVYIGAIILPLKTMLHGNQGDELFILAFMNQARAASPFADFYYTDLPAFYPPLHFWIYGTIAKIFSLSTLSAVKLGVLGSVVAFFGGGYYLLKKFSRTLGLLIPSLLFVWVGPDAFITKPYEILTALLLLIWCAFFAKRLKDEKWDAKKYAFFGVLGGTLFLTYYFWWFIAIPTLLTICLLEKNRLRNLIRLAAVGLIIFLISTPYLIPLISSFFEHGIENWQARHMILTDFDIFLPWLEFSVQGLLAGFGLLGLILLRKQKIVRTAGLILIFSYAYQAINYIIYISGGWPAQPSKPFFFLGGAALMTGAASFFIYAYNELKKKYSQTVMNVMLVIFLILLIWPLATFVTNDHTKARLAAARQETSAPLLAKTVQQTVPDYTDRLWLSSGAPELNAHIPLHYYIAHNAHFSHQASNFSKRLDAVREITASESAEALESKLNEANITGLLLYYDQETDSYPLFFWVDNFPHGGRTLRLDLPANIIEELSWQTVYDNDWRIILFQ